jgi:hypothetical protein
MKKSAAPKAESNVNERKVSKVIKFNKSALRRKLL